ncbi:hypothetical protein B0F90DRAFT_1685127, partial [Multifurca ochricompacta]
MACRALASLAVASPSTSISRAHKSSRSLTTLSDSLNQQSRRLFPPSTTNFAPSANATPHLQSSPSPTKRPVLQPYELSRRLIALCRRGDAHLAVNMLQHAPRNAQNIKVWNTLIQQCMDAKRYQLAYRVFTEMKRRGFMPNIRTYATIMSGYATIEDWGPLTKQLGLAHSIYAQLKQHLDKSRNMVDDPASESAASFALYPIALYISILGKAGKYQKAFDVFHELDTDGPLAPHPKVYSSLLCALADRVDSVDAEATAQSVSDAKYVWRRHMRSVARQPEHYIEPRSVDAIIKVLSRGEPSDHELMFDILRDICGLSRLGEDRMPPKVEPNIWILGEVLDSCVMAGRPEMAVHYAQMVMDTPKLQLMLHAGHLHKLLHAQIILAKEGSTATARSENAASWIEWMVAQGHKGTAPNKYTLTFALELCYRCEDTPSALRIARVMLEGPMRGSMPTKAWAHLLRLAIVASPNDKRQCLELLSRYNSVLDVWESGSAVERLAAPEKKTHVSLALYVFRCSGRPNLHHLLMAPKNSVLLSLGDIRHGQISKKEPSRSWRWRTA